MPEETGARPSRSFDVRIVFHGLIGLVPADRDRLLLPLPDLSRGTEPEPEPHRLPERIPPHLACIVVPRKYVGTGQDGDSSCPRAKPVLEFQLQVEDEEVQQLFRFERERLTLRYPDSGTGVLSFPGELGRDHTKPTDPDAPSATDLAWVPPLERTGIQGAGKLDGRLLTRDYAPEIEEGFNRLIGTVLIDSGTLSTTGVVENRRGGEAVFDFFPAGTPEQTAFSQAMFDRMIWEGTVAAEGLELVLTKGGADSRSERCIQLTPEDGRLEFAVHNQELEDILGIGFGTGPIPRDADPDFAVGYWLSCGWDSLGRGAAVIPRSPALGPGGSGEACKTGRYAEVVWP